MPRRPEDIIIEEPPIEKLTKQNSCVRRSCLSCLSFILIVLGISLVVLKLTINAQTKELKKVPAAVVRAVPVYDLDNIDTITLTAGSERSRGVERAAFVPKLIVSPLIISLDRKNAIIHMYRPDLANKITEKTTWWEKFNLLMRANVGDHRDEIKIVWNKLPTDTKFINEYYTTELQKRNFKLTGESETDHIEQFTFAKDAIEGSLYIEDNDANQETDKVIFTITMDIPHI
jgi:hypothetical protein